jgi:hypothetical protein
MLVVLVLVVLLLSSTSVSTQAQTSTVYYPQTGHFLRGAFRAYFESKGGVSIFGYPITEEYVRASDGTIVQYFERARFELHSLDGQTVVVRLGSIGQEYAARLGYNFPRIPPIPDTPNIRYFPETGHSMRGGFKAFWDRNNGAELFGAPISEEFSEYLSDGSRRTVQYFERARFELHGNRVLLGLLGRALAPCQQVPPRPRNLPPSGPLMEGDGRNCAEVAPLAIGRVYPEVGRTGEVMGFEARYFQPGEAVAVWLNLPNQDVRDLRYDVNAASDGGVLIGFRTRTDDPPGNWSLVAQGLSSNRMVVAPFRLER